MGLTDEFGLFEGLDTNSGSILNGGNAIIKGRPKRKLGKFITKPVKILLRPIKKKAKKKIITGIGNLLFSKEIPVKEALAMDKKRKKIKIK